MAHIFREKNEIPVPKGAYVNPSDARVYRILQDIDGKKRRQVIGRVTSIEKRLMYPNENFRYCFPNLWHQYYGDNELKPHSLRIGLYAATLAIATQSGCYEELVKIFGVEKANAIMDYAMFSIAEQSDVTQLFEKNMASRLCFSRKTHTDSWFSQLFSHEITEDQIDTFRQEWLERSTGSGDKQVWLCVDGSNIDCSSKQSDLNEHGKAKSHKNIPLIGFIWAVDAHSAMPVTWYVNPGNMVDSKAVLSVIEALSKSNVKVKGAIVDRGFAVQEVFDVLEENALSYIAMLKGSYQGSRTMVQKHGAQIRWNFPYLVAKGGVFGITDQVKVFKNSAKEQCVALLFDSLNGSERVAHFTDKVLSCVEQLNEKINHHEKDLSICPEMRKYVQVVSTDGEPTVQIKTANCQNGINEKGFQCIASSEQRTAQEIHRLYQLRDVSEKQFSILKSQLGYNTTRVHRSSSMRSKLAIAFIASIIRTEFMNTCKRLKLDTNQMLLECDRCQIHKWKDDSYSFVDDLSERQWKLFSALGLNSKYFEQLASEVEQRFKNPAISQLRQLPDLQEKPKPRVGRPPKNKPVEVKVKRRPGRPKGSKNKKTLEIEKMLATMPAPVKRGRGRPKGSKNKKTLKLEQQRLRQQQGNVVGRPKGSKNAVTLAKEKNEQRRLARIRANMVVLNPEQTGESQKIPTDSQAASTVLATQETTNKGLSKTVMIEKTQEPKQQKPDSQQPPKTPKDSTNAIITEGEQDRQKQITSVRKVSKKTRRRN